MIVLSILLASASRAQVKLHGTIKASSIDYKDLFSISLNPQRGKPHFTLSDSTGYFSFASLSGGNYELVCTHQSYLKVSRQIQLRRDTAIEIFLKPMIHQLDDAVVQGRKPLLERKADRTILNVPQNRALEGGNGIDAIKAMPGIVIKKEDIKIAGRGNVAILVDDKLLRLSGQDLIQYLQATPTSMIERVELLSNPPAKYDAEGSTGLVHLVLKKKQPLGLSGVLNSSYEQAASYQKNLSANLTLTSKLFRLNISPSFRKGIDKTYFRQNVYYRETDVLEHSDEENSATANSGYIDLSANLSKQSKIGIAIDRRKSESHRIIDDRSAFVGSDLDSLLTTTNLVGSERTNTIYNAYLESKIDTQGKKISLSAVLLRSKNDKSSTFSTNSFGPDNDQLYSYSPLSSANERTAGIFTIGADVSYPTAFADFEFGGKITISQNRNNSLYDSFKGIDANNSRFDYDEKIYAFYGSISKKLKKVSLIVGLRAENTGTRGHSLSLNQKTTASYFRLFPSANFSFQLDNDNTFSITYGRRIRRPDYASMDPFRIYNSVLSYNEGNPYLKPSYFSNFEVTHLYKDFLSSAAYLNYSTEGFDAITVVDESSFIQRTIRTNFMTTYEAGLTENISFDLSTWLSSSNQAQVYYCKIRSSHPATRSSIEGLGANVSTSNVIFFGNARRLSANLNFEYYFPAVNGLDKMKSFSSLDVGINVKLAGEQIRLGLLASDILKNDILAFTSQINGLTQYYYEYQNTRQVRLSLSYSFGNKKILEKRKVHDDELDRTN